MRAYLRSMGFENGEISRILATTHAKNPEIVRKKMDYYRTSFGFSNDDLKKIIKTLPPFLGYETDGASTTSVSSKVEFYKINFNLTDEEVARLIKISPGLLGLDVYSVADKLDYLQDYFEFSNGEILELVKTTPAILGYDVKWKTCEKVSFYSTYFGIDEEGAKKIIKARPNLLGRSTEGVEKRVEFLSTMIGCSQERAKKIILSLPTILTYDLKSMLGKVKYYEKALSLSPQQAGAMIGKCPSIICYSIDDEDEKSAPRKLKYLRQIATDEEIAQNPALLTHPALKLKTRYLILAQVFERKEIVGNRKMTTSEDKLWGRLRYCEEGGHSAKAIIRSESRFRENIGVTSQEVVRQYPLTLQDIKRLEKSHEEKTGESIHLDQFEIEAVFGSASEGDEELENV